MASIPPEKLARIAAAAAVEWGRPWRVEDLRMKALAAYRAAMRRTVNSGLSREQASAHQRKLIYEQVSKAGREMDPLPFGQSKPTPRQIETALGSFTVEDWTPVEPWPPIELSPPMEGWPIIEARHGLMESVGRVEVEALLDHIRRDTGDLKRKIGTRKLEAIEGVAIMRHVELSLPDDRSMLNPVSDVYWSLLWPDLARQANREGKGHPATGRSVAELSSNRSIARHLSKRDEQTGREMKVSRYEIRRWRARAERLPFEQYAADVGADDDEKRAAAFIDWLTMIRKKYQRKS
jgi:hypothetical protein